jgi:hypothetical protein
VWIAWRTALVIVKSETIVSWHRRGVRLFWTWKRRRGTGRPRVPADVRARKLGIAVCEATVARYMVRHRRPPSQTWRTFV